MPVSFQIVYSKANSSSDSCFHNGAPIITKWGDYSTFNILTVAEYLSVSQNGGDYSTFNISTVAENLSEQLWASKSLGMSNAL